MTTPLVLGNNATVQLSTGNNVVVGKNNDTIIISGGGNTIVLNNNGSVEIDDTRMLADGFAGTVAFGSGEAMILAATLLWAVEVVYVKRLLVGLPSSTLAAARMGLGTVLLLGWLAVQGTFGQLGQLDTAQWKWVVLGGLLLTAYVATWYAALARAQAVDVTAVLVFGAVVTALLSGGVDGKSVSVVASVLVTAGAALIGALAFRSREAVA